MRNLLTYLLLFVFFSSCDSFQKKEEKQQLPKKGTTPLNIESNKDLIVKMDSTNLKIDSVNTSLNIKQNEVVKLLPEDVILRLEKKPCSGDCPEFSIDIKTDSVLVFHGFKNIAKEGVHQVKLTGVEFHKIKTSLLTTSFSDYNDNYYTDEAKDFSETLFTYQNKQVGVKMWKDAPEQLTDLYVLLEDFLYNKKLLEE